MFLKIQIDENTRRMVFEDSKSTAGIVGDSNVDGAVFYLPEDSEYSEKVDDYIYFYKDGKIVAVYNPFVGLCKKKGT